MHMTVNIIAYSLLTTLVIGTLALIAGFHGNFPWLWVYLLGPVAWLCRLMASDSHYFWALGIGTFLMSLSYWCFFFVASARFSESQRKNLIAAVHLCFGLAFHLIIGLPP